MTAGSCFCYNIDDMEYSVCLLASGQGSRTRLHFNKVHYILGDLRNPEWQTVLDCSLQVFLKDPDCKQIILTCLEKEQEFVRALYKDFSKVEIIVGGATRQDSVSRGLALVEYPYVFIHDAARPYIKQKQIEDLKKTLMVEDACLLVVPATDTVKIVENGYVKETPSRTLVFHAQTPQCFKTSLIKACHEKARQEGKQATDDAQLVEWYADVPVKAVIGDISNSKITWPEDLG